MHKFRTHYLCLLLVLVAAAPAYAHHEAMFGPQSAAVLSPKIFVAGQVFNKETGKDTVRQREMTIVGSLGFTPIKGKPLSMALVLPVTIASGIPEPRPGLASWGWEDTLVTARYRQNTPTLTSALHVDQTYVMGVGGLELPTGTYDHPFGKGAYGGMTAALVSVEKKPVALIGYGYYHHRGEYNEFRDSGNMFAGGGFAYTPIDDEAAGKLFSLQLGMSYERTFQEEINGMPVTESGASGVFMHPGIVVAASPNVQIFGLVSLPLTQQWRSLDDRQRFRLGTGVIWILKHSGT
jgi:hypothetical protein